jgi:hypothetical protein
VRWSYTVQSTYCRNNNAEERQARKITAILKGKFHILGFRMRCGNIATTLTIFPSRGNLSLMEETVQQI